MDYHYEVSDLHITTNLSSLLYFGRKFFSNLFPSARQLSMFSFLIVAFCLWQRSQCPRASLVMLFFPTTVLKDQFLSFPPLTIMD